MARKQLLRHGLCLLAGVLVGAAVELVSIEANARAHYHRGTRALHVTPPGTAVQVSRRDAVSGARQQQDRGAPRSDDVPHTLSGATAGGGGKQPSGGSKETWPGVPARDANAPDFQIKGLGPIDTRITVQPRLHGVGSGTVRQVKSKIGPLGSGYSQARHTVALGKTSQITRNAIGLQIMPRNVVPAHSPAPVHLPATIAPVAPSNGGVLKPAPDPGRLAVSHPGPLVNGQRAARPALNGNGFVRRGFVPATLGGPSKEVVVGIDGSAIRPKH